MCESDESLRLDQEIVHRLQYEHPEQFVTLVRMHLSFELDLNTDTENDPASTEKTKGKKWKGFHKKARSCASTRTSPEAAKTVLTKENIRVFRQLINFLVQEQNISQEGIFRKTGSVQRQMELKNALVHGVPICLEKADYYTAHDCASVLKNFLADLSEPLLTEMYYPAYCQVAEFCQTKDLSEQRETRLLTTIQLLLLLLPKENNTLLRHLMDMLYKTTQYEATNKMSADNLATLFTPHLICPRKLSPEALHATSQHMYSIVSFMISMGPRLFYIPTKLATDIRAFYVERKRRKTMSPEHILNESITSETVANTIYTFVDREKTAEAHVTNSTDTALAQLYAHIQSLPESSKKKKLIKQFNRENGHGTPLQVLMLRENSTSGSITKGSKSISDSIKRHIFHKNMGHRTPKQSSNSSINFQHTPNGTTLHIPKQRVLFQSPLSSTGNSPAILVKRLLSISGSSSSSSEVPSNTSSTLPVANLARSNSSSSTTSNGSQRSNNKRIVEFTGIDEVEDVHIKKCKLTDEKVLELPDDDDDFIEQEGDDIGDADSSEDPREMIRTLSDYEEDRYSSPDGRTALSDSRSKFKSEPNLSTIIYEGNHNCAPSTSKEKAISFLRNKLIKGVSMGSLKRPFGYDSRSSKKSSSTSLLKCCFEDNLRNAKKSLESYSSSSIASSGSPHCRLTGVSPLDNRHKPISILDYDHVNMINENNANLDCWNAGYSTSTPALSGRDSMSPITKSTQRMPKSMQESIMTPRSRKPVMLSAGINVGDQQHSTFASQTSFGSLREEDEDDTFESGESLRLCKRDTNRAHDSSEHLIPKSLDCPKDSNSLRSAENITSSAECVGDAPGQSNEDESCSLTNTFREYLLSRSALTDSPADLSFSSQPDDFDSDADIENLSESKMSESLLFCMNGNKPEDDSESTVVGTRTCFDTDTGSEITIKDNSLLLTKSGRAELDETSL